MKKKRRKLKVWKDEYYITCYDLARQGQKNTQIAKIIGVSIQTFKQWIKDKPALKAALVKARQGKMLGKMETITEYVYDRLPAHLQDVWDELDRCENEPNGIRRAELILANQGERAKQYLFIHALMSNNFNTFEACRRINISRKTVERWVDDDPDFAELLTEITVEVKKDLVESALFGLVRQGDTSAIIYASKTLNRDRGYGDRTEVHHTGAVMHGQVSLDDLNLTVEEKRMLLNKTREHNGTNILQVNGKLLPEPVEVPDEDEEEEGPVQ